MMKPAVPNFGTTRVSFVINNNKDYWNTHLVVYLLYPLTKKIENTMKLRWL